jgi:guanine deaminase
LFTIENPFTPHQLTGPMPRHPDERFMRLAIEKAKEGIAGGQTPFGACVVKGEEVVGLAHNTVWADTDITAHAEMNAIREACAGLGTVDLSGCVVYSTTEPCPMCFSAIHWAGISMIVYGAKIRDAREAGFRELPIINKEMQEMGGSQIRIVGGFLKEECLELFKVWKREGEGPTY